MAPVNDVLAPRSDESDGTVTPKANVIKRQRRVRRGCQLHQRGECRIVVASSAVEAGSEITRPQRRLAVGTDKLVRAPASVAVDSIDARSTIQTRAATSNTIVLVA